MIKGCILSVISAAAYAVLPILTKLAYEAGLTEWDTLLCRFISALFFVTLFLLIKDRRLFRIDRKPLILAALIGTFIYTSQSTFYFKSLLYLPASTSALILYGYPAVVTIMSAIFLKMPITRVIGLSLIAVTAGCALVFYDAFLRKADPYGLLLMTTAMLIFSTYIFTSQFVVRHTHPLTAAFYIVLFTTISFCVIHPPVDLIYLSPSGMFYGMLLGLIPTAIAIVFLYSAIETVGSAYTSIFSSIEPVCTVALAAVFLGEQIVIWQIFGTVLILFGVLYPNVMTLLEKKKIDRLNRQMEENAASREADEA